MKKILMIPITTMVWSLSYSQTSWNVKSSGPSEASLWTKLVEVMNSSGAIPNPERWCCESAALNMPANLEKSAVATGLEKVSFHSNLKERQITDKHWIKHRIKEPEIKLPTSAGSWKKQESSRKTSISALLTMPRHLTVWITQTVENSSRDGNTRPPDLPPEKSVCWSRINS